MNPRQAAQSEKRSARISAEERLDILDLVGRYLFAVDSGQEDDLIGCFADDGEVIYSTGEHFLGSDQLRLFARKAIGGEDCLGRMHVNLPLFFRREGNSVVLTSYLSTAIWQVPEPPKAFGSLRMIEDACVRINGQWKIRTRKITIWNSEAVRELRQLKG